MRSVFGLALLAHLVVFALVALFSDGENPKPEWEAEEAEQPLVPLAPAADPTPRQASREEGPSQQTALEQGPRRQGAAEQPMALRREGVAAELPESMRPPDLQSGILVELPSGRVLWEQRAQEAVPIASMTKMMTALLIFEDEQRREDLDFDTVIPVTDEAYRIGGSQVWLDPRESFALRELMISVMVKSANDSAYLLAEHVSGGDMAAFVARMNQRARELGMSASRFINAHGLPEGEESNLASCADLVRVARALLRFDVATEWASIPRYTFRPEAAQPTELTNHNRLVGRVAGVDGLKTGYTKRAGYCLTATAERHGRRLIAVATGFSSGARRDAFVAELLDWGYQQ